MFLKDFISTSRARLSDLYPADGMASLYSPEEAAALVSRLCEAVLGVAPYAHIVHPELEIPETSLPVLQASFARLLAGEPLQYVLGYTDFLGMRLRVTPAVLIPRPETEELCRRVIASYPSGTSLFISGSSSPAFGPDAPTSGSTAPRSILDLCCGSGCITWAMARAFPDALVVGVDLSADALEVARGQSVPSGMSAPSGSPASEVIPTPIFLQADVLNVSELLRMLESVLEENDCSGFDLLLSNPPYVCEQERSEMSRNVLDFEPSMALFVPDEDALCFYRAIREVWFSPLLHARARLALEINEALGPETLALFQPAEALSSPRKAPFSTPASRRPLVSSQAYARLEKDFNKKNRFIFAEK